MAFLTQSAFGEIATLLVLAATVGFVGIILRQPLIVSFIAVGLIAKISEFSLIFVAMGVALGPVDSDALGLVIMVGLVTIAAST